MGSSCRPPTCRPAITNLPPATCRSDPPPVRIAFPVNRPSIAKPHLSNSVAKKFDAVPLLDLHRQYKTIREEVLAAIERVCSSQKFILGAEVEALESEIFVFTGVAEAVGCASGTNALWLVFSTN